ncbi:tyrosinase family protein [Chryseobacterium sp. JUb7]|uniref:tyrosinase family protein n=1 Tax=Chryseobacterium sp. JUb7 TaxID=2940599 RepID=UPI0021691B36|nr:tyrosinase family protein [Chryseobacterium sp. JUb7]MCS3533076.1 tyrosinase [Chryseobacterium sp. JUb7]
MKNFLRKNAWDADNGGQFVDQEGNYTDLYWYAKGVQVMKSKPISDPTSWWFYAAIHGQYLVSTAESGTIPTEFPNWEKIQSIPPDAQLNSPPSKKLIDLFWDQCQHGTWFFPPWHRGYLAALENILRNIISQECNGPDTWALPYWNYLNQSQVFAENKIPPAFTLSDLPDGSPNPLYVPERYGPNGDKNIMVIVAPNTTEDPSANDECQWDTIFSEPTLESTGTGNLNGYFYGGEETGFMHSNGGFGDLESNPHNFVHVMVGGFNGQPWTGDGSDAIEGLMADPGIAGLDPIFYLHHANVDRMWAAWNVTGKNANSQNPNWLAGPSSQGNSQFAMPLDDSGTPWYYTPEDVQDTENLKYYNGEMYSYSYDDLSLVSYDTTPPASLRENLTERLSKLGVTGTIEKNLKIPTHMNSELIGASKNSISLNSGSTQETVKLDSAAWKSVSKSFSKASANELPDEIYLQLDNVRGTNNANFLSLYVNDIFVRSVALFGIRMASQKDSAHGEGLTFKFNITHVIDSLHLKGDFDINSLDVQIKTRNPIPEESGITVGRISIYRIS